MKKKIVCIGILLVIVYCLFNIYKEERKATRNEVYDKLGTIEISLGNDDNKIEPAGYKNGFDFNYDALPVIQIKDSENTIFFELVDDSVDKIIVGEDYYAGSTCYKETYTINKTLQGKFELPIKREINNKHGKHATYYIKYNLDDEGVFVFIADFLSNANSQSNVQ